MQRKLSILGDDGIGHCEKKIVWKCVRFFVVTKIELLESADLTPLEFCLWCWMKREVYKIKVGTPDELLAGTLDAAVSVKELSRTTRDLRTRVAKCTEVDGGVLEHLLWTVTDLLFPCNKLLIETLY